LGKNTNLRSMLAWVLKGPLPAGWEQDVEKSWAKVLSWEPVPEKPLPPKWVRIQVAAAALNRRDAWIVAGHRMGQDGS